MTAEIAVMNKLAIAIAADSAATVGGKVFNSANKIFALSKHHPVGVMICGSSELSGVPWETLIKLYRGNRNGKSFPHLKEYVEDFFHFLNQSSFFNKDYINSYEVRNKYRSAVKSMLDHAKKEIEKEKQIPSKTKLKKKFGSILDGLYKTYSDYTKYPFVLGVNHEKQNEFLINIDKVLEEVISEDFSDYISSTLRRKRLKELAGAIFMQQDAGNPGVSEIIFAGFGNDEHFPVLISANCDGVYEGIVWRTENHTQTVAENNNAAIVPFAQTDVVRNFITGIDPDLEETFWLFLDQANDYAKKKLTTKKSKEEIQRRFERFKANFSKFRNNNHVYPLIQQVASLPMDELAKLAESLVSITSLKRHVTADVETVGGPIDVAVISKNDGLIWVNRKEYFDGKSNNDYFMRQNSYFKEDCDED